MQVNNFRTEIDLKKFTNNISYKNKILIIGSCFSENIGKKFIDNKFTTIVNPFGILYNPISISNSLGMIIEKKTFSEENIFYHNEQWHSFYHHGKFSKSSKEEVLNLINNSICESNKFINELDYLIITFGSSYVYRHKETNIIVSNCHKLPENRFDQYMLNIEEMENKWIDLINNLKEKNKDIKIIFTVSPIRYLKYGFASNSLSKSNLLVLVNKLKEKFSFIDYFPSYEIMMDDLRDYRFYEKDMIHPNETAIEYIWDKFTHSYIEKNSIEIMNEILKLKKSLLHRSRNPKSIENKNFILKNIEIAKKIEYEYSFINLSNEIQILENNLEIIKKNDN